MTLPELQRALGHRKADQSLSYASIVAKDAVVRSSAYDRDEGGEVVELRAVASWTPAGGRTWRKPAGRTPGRTTQPSCAS